ncbi:helix-turn-helix transcriptional regulator [Paenibacillus rigui]|uniref:AraC family transcriptional regulator n=1 Tax=Paenibacillus rigui TaxID=554312 RepID=A0A229UVU3_9BACL|nr:AraC family transcriptional regulator [Paenibacillus rigui]OXM87423.1 AraC family transcriptional regulator [Paenibacillus rigui]
MRAAMREDHHEFLEIHYFTPSEYEKAGAAWPIRIGHNRAKPNYHIGPRISPYYYLLLVLDGEGTFIQNNRTYALRPYDLFCLFPQVTHEYYTVEDRPLQKMILAFDGKGKHPLQLLERIGLSPDQPHRRGGASPDAIRLMWNFMNDICEPGSRMMDLARLSLFHQLFDRLSAHVPPAELPVHRSVTWLQRGLEYMQIHYAEGITVERVAEYVGVDRTHFTKQFGKEVGMSPIQYMQQLKMNEAKLLLEQTAYTLTEIAQSVGYPDLFSFSKAFKKQVGLPPKSYRAQAGQSGPQHD